MKAAVCEDEEALQLFLEKQVCECMEEAGNNGSCEVFSSAEELLEKGNPFYDLYLLDIQLGQMTGMELAEKIREKDDHAVILFATNYKEMIRKAFQVSALDYLVKPLDEVEVRQALLRSFRYLSKKRNRIALKNQSGVEICSRRGSGEFYVRLNDLEHEFKGSLLVRVHASFIINLEKIRSVRKDTITMESGKEIPVTRKYKDQFNRAFQNYCLEMRR